MPETKKYAVRCSTEEQAREFRGNIGGYIHGNLYYLTDCGFFGHIDYVSKNGYTIITYEEARKKGLLVENINYVRCDDIKQIEPIQVTTTPCPKCGAVFTMGEDGQFHQVKEEVKEESKLSLLKKRYQSYIDAEEGDYNYKGANELFKIFLKELEEL